MTEPVRLIHKGQAYLYREPSYQLCIEECGGKCCQAPGYLLLSNAEMRLMKEAAKRLKRPSPRVLQPKQGQWKLDMDHNGGACPFFDVSSKECLIYEDRPEACRTYPLGPEFAEVDCLVFTTDR